MTITQSLAQVAESGLESKKSITANEVQLDESLRPNELQFNALSSHSSKVETFEIRKGFLTELEREINNYQTSDRYSNTEQAKIDIQKNFSLQSLLILLIGDVKNYILEINQTNTPIILNNDIETYIKTNKEFLKSEEKINNFIHNKVNRSNTEKILGGATNKSIELLKYYNQLVKQKIEIKSNNEDLEINKKYLIEDLQKILQSKQEDIGELITSLQERFQIYENNRKKGMVQFEEEDMLFLQSVKALFNNGDNYKILQSLGYDNIKKDEQLMKDIFIFIKRYNNMPSL